MRTRLSLTLDKFYKPLKHTSSKHVAATLPMFTFKLVKFLEGIMPPYFMYLQKIFMLMKADRTDLSLNKMFDVETKHFFSGQSCFEMSW